MKEILFLTDTHLKKDNFDLNYNIFKQACELCVERRINMIIHVGDIFTVRTGLTLEVLLGFVEIMNMIKSYGIDILAIAGNHDKSNLSDRSSFLDVFESWGLEVCHSETEIRFGKNVINFLPYFPEDTVYLQKLNIINENAEINKRPRILVTHASINGVKNNDGSKVDNELKTNLFKHFELVFVGHYHNRSKVSKNIHYIGSAMPQNFGEDNDKGFVILKEDLTFHTYKPNFPHYYTFEFDADDENFKKDIEVSYKEHKDSKDHIRFKISGSQENLEKFDKSKFLESGIIVLIENVHIIRNSESVSSSGKIKQTNGDLLKYFVEYCKEIEASTQQTKVGLKHFRASINVSNKES